MQYATKLSVGEVALARSFADRLVFDAEGKPRRVIAEADGLLTDVAEFIQRLRAAPATSRLPVLRMSPEGSSSIAGRDGSDATIGSPFRLLELGDKLVRLQDPRS